MELVGAFVSGPAVLALILAVLIAEALALTMLARRRRARGILDAPRPPLRGTLANLMAGACLVLAMLASALDAFWGWNALLLSGAFLAHLFDLRDRWLT